MTNTNLTPHRALSCGLALAVLALVAAAPALAQQGSLYVVQDKVGVGTDSPDVSLEVQGATGATAILVDENSATSALRNLLILDNQGPPRILFNDTGANKSWRVGAYFGNTFRFDTPSGPGTEMELGQDGNLTIRGTLNQGSSRTFKENFMEVDPKTVLARVATLPITSWSYIADSDGARHLGPVAEDFRATFQLGTDDKHLAPADTAGVALAAIKGLNQVVQEGQAESARLREENDRLRATVDALASAQEQLLQRLEALETGKK